MATLQKSLSLFLVTIWILLLMFVCHNSAKVEPGLYNSSDYVVILSSNNFESVFYGTKNGWIIEFYNAWCGHCINYASTWAKFAESIKNWHSVIKVGAINCADEKNTALCREYEVMGYPAIKLFGTNSQPGDLGVLTRSRSVEDLKRAVIDFLIEQEKAKNSSSDWVKLLPLSKSFENILHENENTKQAAFIFCDSSSYVSSEVILELSSVEALPVRRVISSLANKSQPVAGFHDVLLIQNGITFAEEKNLRGVEDIKNFILSKYNIEMTTYKISDFNVHSDVAENNDLLSPLTSFSIGGSHNIDQVFFVDIENALSYTFNHELLLRKVILGDELQRLKTFIEVLAKYLPARPSLLSFLQKLNSSLQKYSSSIRTQQFAYIIESINTDDSFLPHMQPYIGCLGSEPKYRGYTCGLWTLFHTITIAPLVSYSKVPLTGEVNEILKAIHGYVMHFLSCSECSQNFQKMYAIDAESFSTNLENQALWLWKGHNKVNKRLSGDLGEDPMHKKQQFPAKKACPQCWNGDELIDDESLKYLKKIYSKMSISLKGVHNKTGPSIWKRSSSFLKFEQFDTKIESSIFNSTDVSLCVLLYGVSICMVLVLYFCFVMRRNLRKKRVQEHKCV